MDAARSRWKRTGLRLLLLAVAAPVLSVAAADLWLSLPWGRNWVASKVSARLHVPVALGAMRWTPWGGATLDSIEISAPPAEEEGSGPAFPPVLKTGRIRVDLAWSRILRGHPAFDRVTVDDPDLALSPALLALLSSRPGAITEEQPLAVNEPPAPQPPVAALPPGSSVAAPPVSSSLPAVPAGEGTAFVPSTPQPAPSSSAPGAIAQTPASPPAAAEPSRPEPDLRPPSWLEVRRARVRVLASPDRPPLMEASGIDLSLPLQGPHADGRLAVSSLILAGNVAAENLALPIQWRSPEIRVLDQPIHIAGVEIDVALRLARIPSMPFLFQCHVPVQAMPPWQGPLDRTLVAKKVEFLARAAGSLTSPATWQAQLHGLAENVRVEGPERIVNFDRGDVVLLFNQGLLRCPEARLIGEDFSLLGNGFAQKGGASAGVLRWVVPPDAANGWAQRLAAIDPALQAHFIRMETPERVFIDLGWVAPHEEKPAGIELGTEGSVIPLREFLSLLGSHPAVAEN